VVHLDDPIDVAGSTGLSFCCCCQLYCDSDLHWAFDEPLCTSIGRSLCCRWYRTFSSCCRLFSHSVGTRGRLLAYLYRACLVGSSGLRHSCAAAVEGLLVEMDVAVECRSDSLLCFHSCGPQCHKLLLSSLLTLVVVEATSCGLGRCLGRL
jgi:hypothetical protein